MREHLMFRAWCGGLMLGLALAAGVPSAQAQYAQPRRPGSPAPGAPAMRADGAAMGADAVVIRELIGTGRRTLVRTPEYKTSVPKSSTHPKEWAQISVKFDTTPEWIDVMTIEYHVLSMIKRDGERVYSLMRQNVEHVDIERGRDKLSAVFIPPPAVTRHGPPAAVHVSCVVDGRVVAEADEVDPAVKPLPLRWWESKEVLESKSLTVRDGNLWLLSATPFALVNPDDYEVMR